ncbi:MAG: Ig-like domain-containing protein [Planctomycetota bacterium]
MSRAAGALVMLLGLLLSACGGGGGGGAGGGSAARLQSLAITPTASSVALGFSRNLTATGTYTDMTTRDVTAEVEWSSSNTLTATVGDTAGARGKVDTLAVGTATITVHDAATGVTASTTLTVTPAVLVSIAVTPPSAARALGTTQQFTATGTFSDSTTQDLTAAVTWSSTNAAAASVSAGLATTAAIGNTTIMATHTATGIAGSAALQTTAAALVSIAVTPPLPSVALGTTRQFTATGTFTDHTTQDLTTSVTWSSSNTGVATIGSASGNEGFASSHAVGTTTITATKTGTTITGSTTFTVTAAVLASITLTPTTPTVALGRTQQFTAMGTFSDNSVQDLTTAVTWTSSAPAVATISNAVASQGLASTASVGTTTITATDPTTNVTGQTSLTVSPALLVSIDVTPTLPSISLGSSQQFTAMGTFSDNTTQDLTTTVTWSTMDPSVATISNAVGSQGLATSAGTGAATILAVDPGSLVSGGTTLTVTPATLVSIDVTPSLPTVAAGYAQQFTATGTYSDNTTQDLTTVVTWTSSNPAVATISNASGSEGLASTLAANVTFITATDPTTNIAGATTLTVSTAVLVSVSVTPPLPHVALGYTQQFTATGTFSDNTTADLTDIVTWSSTNASVASVSNTAGSEGLATSLAVGFTDVTATEPLSNIAGGTRFTVDAAALLSIEVTPTAPSVALGYTQQFTATGTFSDNTTQDLTTTVTWSSSAQAIATIANAGGSEGLATSVGIGSTTIQAAAPGTTISGATTFSVTQAVLVSLAVTPSASSVALGYTQQFTATGTFSDSTTQDLTTTVTWSSSNPAAVAISNGAGSEGLATTIAAGTVGITAAAPGSAISDTTTFDVTPAVLVSVAVTPNTTSIALGLEQQFTATGTFSDNTTQDLTASVTWSTSGAGVATISNASGGEGLATTVSIGVATITAVEPGTNLSGTATLTVTAATLVSIGVTPADSATPLGVAQQFAATGTFTDNTTQDLTASVTWSTSNPSIATIDNAGGSEGLASPVAVGAVTVTATDPATSILGTTTFTVAPAVLMSLDVTPGNASTALGYERQFTATGTFSDSTTQDLTSAVTWSTSNTAIAAISNAGGSEGLATTLTTGSVTVAAAMPGTAVVGTTTFTVTPAVLVSIAVTPGNASTALGYERQFTATGTFSDSTTLDLTDTVTWSTSNAAIVTISNASGSNGLASTVATGSVTVVATDAASSVLGVTNFTVSPSVLVSIAVTSAASSLSLGLTQHFTATGTFSDTTTQDLTTMVTWGTSNAAIATVSNASGTQGVVTGHGVGAATITAVDPGTNVSGTTPLTVTAAVLVSIAVTPANPTVALGSNQQFTATGTYSDNSTQDLTASVTWSSSSTSVATIANTVGSEGLATSVAMGSTTITATESGSGLFASTTLTVSNPIVLRSVSSATGASGLLSLNLGKPVNLQDGDVLIAAVCVRPSSATVTAPAGWTLIRRTNSSSPGSSSLLTYRRVAGPTEPASWTWSFSTSQGSAGCVLTLQGVDTSNIVDVENGHATTSSLTHSTQSVTTTTANTMVLTFHEMTSSATWTPPTGMTEAVDIASDQVPSNTGISLLVSWQFTATAGSTGVRTATASNNAATGIASIVALRH